MPDEVRRFDEVAEGDVFNLTKDPVTTRQLVMYAGASGDYNRIHYDQPFAIEAGLGGVIAHGMLTMGFAGQAVTTWAGPGALVRDISGRFLTPVRPGDSVRFDGHVTRKFEAGGQRCCELEVTGHVEDKQVFAGGAVVALAR
ncbi:MaoC/PaaZ C-terminal domain-containing protein [Ferruginivarius sediminum]|uniref:Dehydratase n=1 Tax=Ferruginivarius sediminum TaxID=2661937 RepID=A0A369TAJ6_9PROT|nr:MaoC/PaaZ C-terminal domain-containing protein [Ferruginivarius sediminum]RDD62333.1 dehydratase [Ferruginivarius sediminum]